jgi:hypothetical protein
MVGVLASACGALLTGGIDDTIYWVTHVLRAVAERPWPANQSLAAVIERLAPGPALSIWTGGEYVTVHLRALLPSAAAARLLTRIGQFSILAVTGWVVWRRGAVGTAEALRRDLALGVLLMSLLVPVVWDHYYLQLLLPAAVLADVAGRDTTSRQALIVAALGIILQRFWRQLLLHFGSTGLVLLGGFAAVVVLWAALLYDDARRWRRMPFASTGPTTAVSA